MSASCGPEIDDNLKSVEIEQCDTEHLSDSLESWRKRMKILLGEEK